MRVCGIAQLWHVLYQHSKTDWRATYVAAYCPCPAPIDGNEIYAAVAANWSRPVRSYLNLTSWANMTETERSVAWEEAHTLWVADVNSETQRLVGETWNAAVGANREALQRARDVSRQEDTLHSWSDPAVQETVVESLSGAFTALLNTVFITIMGRVYTVIAQKLTTWENYMFADDHEQARSMSPVGRVCPRDTVSQ